VQPDLPQSLKKNWWSEGGEGLKRGKTLLSGAELHQRSPRLRRANPSNQSIPAGENIQKGVELPHLKSKGETPAELRVTLLIPHMVSF